MKRKSFEREKELLAAALDEFIMKNYEGASLNQIIKKAEISKGTFYYHFRDKQSLYLYLLEHAVKTKWEFINKGISGQTDTHESKDVFESFKLQARIGAEFAARFPKYHMLSQMFAKEKGSEIYGAAMDILGKDTNKMLEAMIDEALSKGELRNDLPRDFIAKMISHLFNSFHDIFATEEDFQLEKMLENLDDCVNFMKFGLGNHHSKPLMKE